MDHKLNKYLIKIVNDYAFIDRENLIKNVITHKKATLWDIEEYTIDDLIVKSIQTGHKGFWIRTDFINTIESLDKKCNEFITIEFSVKGDKKLYCFKNDFRHLDFIHVYELDITIKQEMFIKY